MLRNEKAGVYTHNPLCATEVKMTDTAIPFSRDKPEDEHGKQEQKSHVQFLPGVANLLPFLWLMSHTARVRRTAIVAGLIGAAVLPSSFDEREDETYLWKNKHHRIRKPVVKCRPRRPSAHDAVPKKIRPQWHNQVGAKEWAIYRPCDYRQQI